MEDYEPTYLDDVEEARNRPDKSVLAIRTMCPEKLLASDVAFPEQVKHLWLHLGFNICSPGDIVDEEIKYLLKQDCDCEEVELCHKCWWYYKYTNTLCKDLINFKNLETLTLYDVNLSSDLLSQFAQNSMCLKELYFKSDGDYKMTNDQFEFDGKDKGLEDILKIPTLEKVKFGNLDLYHFPKGPSSLKYLELDIRSLFSSHNRTDKEHELLCESFCNISTHTQLTSIRVTTFQFKLSIFQLDKLEQLEKIDFDGKIENLDDVNSLKAILNLPKLKILNLWLEHKGGENLCFEEDWIQSHPDKVKEFKDKLDQLQVKFEGEKK